MDLKSGILEFISIAVSHKRKHFHFHNLFHFAGTLFPCSLHQTYLYHHSHRRGRFLHTNGRFYKIFISPKTDTISPIFLPSISYLYNYGPFLSCCFQSLWCTFMSKCFQVPQSFAHLWLFISTESLKVLVLLKSEF